MATTTSSFFCRPPFFSFNPDFNRRSGAGTTDQVLGVPEQPSFWISHAHDYIHKIALEYLKASSRAQRFNYRRRLKDVAETHQSLPRRLCTVAPSGTAPAEEKPLPEYLSIL